MGQRNFCSFRAIIFTAAALQLAACGFNPSSSSKSPSGAIPLTAGNNSTSGPLLGAWWDSSHKGLRTVYGVVGAAHQSTPTFSDGSYSGGAACMRQNIALLATASGSLFSVSLPQGVPNLVASNGIAKASIAFSPSCTSSLVYEPGGSGALLLQGLLSTPTITQVALSAGVSAAAVADSGSILMAVPVSDGTTAIQLLASGTNSVKPVTVLSRFGGMAFLPGTDTALIADAAASTVVLASHFSSKVSLTPLAGAADGVSKPAAVAISSDGRLAAIANTDSSVLRLDLSGLTAPVKTICHCAPTELEPLAGNFAFRLTEPGSGTLWAFDGNGPQPRVLFIPTDQGAQRAGSEHGGSR